MTSAMSYSSFGRWLVHLPAFLQAEFTTDHISPKARL